MDVQGPIVVRRDPMIRPCQCQCHDTGKSLRWLAACQICFHGSLVYWMVCFDTARSLGSSLFVKRARCAMSSGKEDTTFRPKVRSGDGSSVHDIA